MQVKKWKFEASKKNSKQYFVNERKRVSPDNS